MKRDNKQLYEHIMRNVSREVKKTLNEAGFVGQRIKKDKIYPKYLVFYIVGYDTDPYMHPHADGKNSLDEIAKYVGEIIYDDDLRFDDINEKETLYNNFLQFLDTYGPQLRVGQFAQFEIKKYVNFLILRQK